jgi:hypothetical protein
VEALRTALPTEVPAVDVAVVGGGVAGCYLGYRLLAAGGSHGSPALPRNRPPVVALYEASGRLGGRLWSIRLPGRPDTWAELGGMRFHPRSHLVVDLLRHLGLAAEGAEFSFGEPENLTYARGVRWRRRELAAGGLAAPPALPYRLWPAERGLGIDELTARAAETALPGFADLRRRHHQARADGRWVDAADRAGDFAARKAAARVGGLPLHQVAWWTLLTRALSQEAIHFIEDTGGYETLAANGSVAGWLDVLFAAPPDGGHRRLAAGFETLPRTLADRFREAGGRIFPGHRLERFDAAPPGYELTFRRQDEAAGSRLRVRARILVLALPPSALVALGQDNFLFRDATVRQGLASLRAVPAAKLFLAYPEPWWECVGVTRGRSTTDLPLRQLWYWSDSRPGQPGVLLAAYASGGAAAYWQGLAEGEPYEDAGADPLAPAGGLQASRPMVERAHEMLLEMHGGPAPAPLAARYKAWSEAWPVWREGYDGRSLIPVLRRPVPGEDVFLVNDGWSHDPGSVQGTLGNAERVLQDHLGFAWPAWLRREGTDLGPPGEAEM